MGPELPPFLAWSRSIFAGCANTFVENEKIISNNRPMKFRVVKLRNNDFVVPVVRGTGKQQGNSFLITKSFLF